MNLKETFFNEIAKLNDNQRQLLKDTVLYGEWGDTVSYFSLYSSTHYDLQMSLREFFDCNIKHLLVE